MIMWREGEREWRERGSKQKARVRDKREGRGQAATFIVDQAYLAVVVGVESRQNTNIRVSLSSHLHPFALFSSSWKSSKVLSAKDKTNKANGGRQYG